MYFNIYLWFLSVVGTFEMCRLVKNYVVKSPRIEKSGYNTLILATNMLFSFAFIPVYNFFGLIEAANWDFTEEVNSLLNSKLLRLTSVTVKFRKWWKLNSDSISFR